MPSAPSLLWRLAPGLFPVSDPALLCPGDHSHFSPRMCLFLRQGSSQQQSASVPLRPTCCSWNSLCMAEWSPALISRNTHRIALQWTSVSLLDHLASEPSSHTWGVFHFLEAYHPLSEQKMPFSLPPSFLSLKQGLLTCLFQSDVHLRLDSDTCGPKRQSPWGPQLTGVVAAGADASEAGTEVLCPW